MQEAEAAGLSVMFGSRVLTTHLAKTTGVPAKVLGADRAFGVRTVFRGVQAADFWLVW
jgi:hypothetical protein